MIRRLLLLGAAAGLAVSPAALPSASAAPVVHGAFDSAPAGFLGCVTPSFEEPPICLAVTGRADGLVEVTALHDTADALGTFSESAVVPASSVRVSGTTTRPWMQIRIPEGVLAETGAVDLSMWSDAAPYDIDWAPRGMCADTVGPLAYAIAADKPTDYVAEPYGGGTVGGRAVRLDCFGGGYGSFFTGPTTGTWAYTG